MIKLKKKVELKIDGKEEIKVDVNEEKGTRRKNRTKKGENETTIEVANDKPEDVKIKVDVKEEVNPEEKGSRKKE